MEVQNAAEAERWQLIESVLDQALVLEVGSERDSLVAELCADDAELLEEVKELLDNLKTDDKRFETPLGEEAADFMQEIAAAIEQSESSGLEGRLLGPYRLLEVLGRGGMGVVCLAERADLQYQKRVAIKLMPRGLETEEIERRFLTERQILANLEHSSIARLLDGGVTDEGYPYLVMELVEGRPIDQYCAEEGLGLEERLELFLEVCDAVQFAHQNLVVHRDLKPSNIMVTADGEVRLLDFGIAKLLDADSALGQASAGQTVFQPRTLAFASPEQVANQPVSTASDVYSMGVLLYRLLTDRSPYELEGLSPTAAEALIRESLPDLPSVAASREDRPGELSLRRAWVRKLRGDLDNVVAKALRKDPARRYATAENLANDLRRYKVGLPVLARKRTRTYIAKKFVQRHRWGVAVAAVLNLAIWIGIAGVFWQARVAAHERDKAQVEARKAERVAEFLSSLFEAANVNALGAGQVTVRQMLDQGETRIWEELADEPEVRGEMLVVISDAYASLGDMEKGLDLAKASVADLRGIEAPDEVLLARALLTLGGMYNGLGNYDQGRPLMLEALGLLAKNDAIETYDGAMTYRYLGLLKATTGDTSGAELDLREALRIWQLLGREAEAAGELNNLAGRLEDQGRWDEAFELKQLALEALTAYYGEEHPIVATTRNNLAISLQNQGEYERAEELYLSALAINERILDPDHGDIADHLTNLGRLLMDQARFEEAEPYVRRAVEIRRATVGANQFNRIATEINLASLLRGLGELKESIALYRSALERFEALAGAEHPATSRVQSLLGQALHQAGELSEAESHLRDAIRRQEAAGVPELTVAESLVSLGAVLCDQSEPAESVPLLRRGLEIFEAGLAPDDWQIATARIELAGALIQQDQLEEAEHLLQSGSEILAQSRPEDSWRKGRAAEFRTQLR